MVLLVACLLILWFSLSRSPVRSRLVAMLSDADKTKQATTFAAAGFFVLSSVFVLLRGHPEVALLLLGGGLWLFNLATKAPNSNAQKGHRPSARQRSAMIEMEYVAATGAMHGSVLAGPEEGRSLDTLSRTRCDTVYAQCREADPEGARLLEAYFDRRFAGWRHAGQSDRDTRRDSARYPNRMSEKEAHEVLGLPRDATRDDIVRTHRALMKKLHPDQGGSTNLAARVNEAKEVLMRRHL